MAEFNLAQSYGAGLRDRNALADQQQQRQLNAFALQDAQRKNESRNAFATYGGDLFSDDAAKSGNAITQIGKVDPMAAFDLKTKIADLHTRGDEAKIKLFKERSELIGGTATGLLAVDDGRLAELTPLAIKQLSAQGIETPLLSQAVQTGDPKQIRQVLQLLSNQAVEAKTQLELKDKDRTFTANEANRAALREDTKAYRGATLAQGAERNQIAAARAANAGQTSAKQQAQMQVQLRKEFDALPDVKNYNEISNAADVTTQLGKSKTASDDVALIFTFMKALDPQSVVREGEFATAQNTVGIPGAVVNAYNRAISGNRLNDQQRAEFAKTVKSVLGGRKKNYDQIVTKYKKYATDSGLPEDTIQGRIDAQAEAAPALPDGWTVKVKP